MTLPGTEQPAWGEHWQVGLEEQARRLLPAHVARYVAAGALDEVTTGEATAAWRAVRLRPRIFGDVRAPELATTLLGAPTPSPVGIAPTSMRRTVHPDGEREMLQAVAGTGRPVVVSSNAGTPFADLGRIGATWWLQAYATADRRLIEPTFRAAADAGAAAVVLTADTPFPGPKRGIDDAAFGDLSSLYGVNHPDAVRGRTPGAEHARDLGPRDVDWLREVTGLPVVVKGVLRADDARRCVDAGAAAVWVSTHGGRQLDRAVASAAALPAVAAEIAADAQVFVDGGIRSGLDALVALALGADAVFVGRPPLWGLAWGSEGVRCVLDHLDEELREALALAGHGTLEGLSDLL